MPKPKCRKADKNKPGFACELYPNCPDREESEMVMTDPGDVEECIGPSYRSEWEEVTGPCEGKCYEREMATPVSHARFIILNGRPVDIGS